MAELIHLDPIKVQKMKRQSQEYPFLKTSSAGMIHLFYIFLITNIILFLIVFSPIFDLLALSPAGKIYESAATSLSELNGVADSCDLFTGEWIPNPEGPYYTNDTCLHIFPKHNCLRGGKPDDYTKWRWKPDGCDLPVFDPNHFLELMRGKSIAFVGDSMTRNHIQSLGCLLSRVAVPVDNLPGAGLLEDNIDWVYKDYNFNMSLFWSAFLVRAEKPDFTPHNLYLDTFDQTWISEIGRYSHVIISGGHWFIYHPGKYVENDHIFGCRRCQTPGVTDFEGYVAYQRALRTALKAVNAFARPGGMVILRTICPDHFEGGSWNDGGKCIRERPYKRNETALKYPYTIFRDIQMEEFRIAEEQGRRRGLRYALLDTTQSMLLRPDGHPSKYSNETTGKRRKNDCVHSCLPGPADIWNDLFLQLLLRDQQRPTGPKPV